MISASRLKEILVAYVLMGNLQESIRRVRSSIVQIVVSATLPDGKKIDRAIIGTGFFVGGNQYIATAAHVFSDTAGHLQVNGATEVRFDMHIPLKAVVEAEFTMRQGFLGVPFKFVEINQAHDLALLKTVVAVARKGTEQVQAVVDFEVKGKTKTYDVTRVTNACLHTGRVSEGEEVAVAGFPLATPYLLTQRGIVSATPVLPIEGTDKDKEEIVVDIMVNPGSSGGPAFLARNGRVIGVCRAHKLSPIVSRSPRDTLLMQNSGLGLVTPVKFLIELLNKYGVKWETRHSSQESY